MQQPEIKTINERYNETWEMFNLIRDKQKEEGLTAKNINRYKMVKIDLGKVLLFGKIEACSGLAYIYKEGLTGDKSDYAYKLFLSIGSKLGNATCTKQLANLQNINEVEKEANIWANVIKNHTKNHDVKTSTVEIADAHTTLERALTFDHVDLRLFENCFDIARSQSSYVTDVYNASPTYSTYIPPEKKYEVKHTGQPAKEGCEIC